MVTRDDLESYLIRMGLDFEEVDEGMYLVQSTTPLHLWPNMS